MVLFLIIDLANVVFCWAIVLHPQFLPMNFVSYVSSLLSPACSRYFQLVLGGSSSFQVVAVPLSFYMYNFAYISVKIRFETLKTVRIKIIL